MSKYYTNKIKPLYNKRNLKLFLGDSFEILDEIKEDSIDMIFADPPYFLSSDGISCQGGKMVSVNKGKRDKSLSVDEKHEFNRTWIRKCKRILKPNGTIWISGTLHNIYSVGLALEQEGFHILNNITWQKLNPPPNLACKTFTHSTETILRACLPDSKGRKKYTFNYEVMKELNGGKQMKDVWQGPLTTKAEKAFGKHPTQKPLYLLERIIEASTNKGDVVLDPFCGSSTTGVACKKLKRSFIGIDNSKEYIKLSKKRLDGVKK